MPKAMQYSLAKVLWSVTSTATGNSGIITFPIADAYLVIADVSAVGGTAPTNDISIQTSPDAGTTWYTVGRFAQIVANGVRSLRFSNTYALNEAATEQALGNTGGALAFNSPIVQNYMRVLNTVSGTTPTAVLKVWLISTPAGNGTTG